MKGNEKQMNRIQITYSDQNQRDDSAPSFRIKQSNRKKYLLHKMKSDDQLLKQKTLKEKQEPAYFDELYRQQKKKLHVNTFIKKLKNSISLREMPKDSAQFLEKDQIQKINFSTFKIPRILYLIILLLISLQNVLLLLLTSISIMFEQMNKTSYFKFFLIFSIFMHLGQMIRNSLIHLDLEDKKKLSIFQSIEKYFCSVEFVLDILIFFSICFVLTDINNSTLMYIGKFIICLKAKNVLQIQSYFEVTFIQNQYRQQVWSLVKVFIFNFIFAHFLTIFLILMAKLNQQQNWIIKKQLSLNNFTQIYVWAYYWATTIMLTVGFGDLTPTNADEALCMIFIQTLSCVVLAYNINRLGVIIQKIRSYDIQQINNMKTFNQMNQNTIFSKQCKEKIFNYIKQSTIIKRDFNLEQEQVFLNKLPVTFKKQLCKQMYRPIWNGMTFFQNLSQKVLINLSMQIQKKLTHPQEIVYSKGSPIQVMIFSKGKFGFSYQNGKSKKNGEIIHSFQVQKNSFKLSTLDFLMENQLLYDIKCLDYSMFYSINMENLVKVLKKSQYDYEYFSMVKDKDKYLINEFELIKCQFCPNQRHTLFKCPKCHYIPLKKHVVDKNHFKQKVGTYLKLQKQKRQSKISYKTLSNIKKTQLQGGKKQQQIQNEKRLLDATALEASSIYRSDSKTSSLNVSLWQINEKALFKKGITKQVQNSYMLQNALQKVQKNLKNELIQSKPFWQIQTDKAYNFKLYFKKYNVDQLSSRKSIINSIKTVKKL